MHHHEKVRHLEYFRSRPELAAVSGHLQFSGILNKKHKLSEILPLLMHLHHQEDLDHTQNMFEYPEIDAKYQLGDQFRQFLESIEENHDIEEIVEQDIRENVFSKQSIDQHFDRIYNKKPKQKGHLHKFDGIHDRYREQFIRHLNDYLLKLGDHQYLEKKKKRAYEVEMELSEHKNKKYEEFK